MGHNAASALKNSMEIVSDGPESSESEEEIDNKTFYPIDTLLPPVEVNFAPAA